MSKILAAVWQCLSHYAYSDAVFAAERLFAEVTSDEALHLLATCYYHASSPIKAYTLLKNKGCSSPQTRLLFAQCCTDLGRYAEAEAAITGNLLQKQKSIDDVINEFGDSASFVLRLLATVYSRTQRTAKAIEVYRRVLKLNPYLWSAFEALCCLGDKPDPTKSFTVSLSQNLFRTPVVGNTQSVVQSVTVPNESKDCTTTVIAKKNILGGEIPHMNQLSQLMTTTLTTTDAPTCITPENTAPLTEMIPTAPRTIRMQPPSLRTKESLLFDCPSLSPLTPSFGVVPLEVVNNSMNTPVTMAGSFTNIEQKSTVKKIQTAVSRSQHISQLHVPSTRPSVFAQSGVNSSRDLQTPSPQFGVQSSNQGMQVLRRSSRLFGNSAVKENNNGKSQLRKVSPKAPIKKLRGRMVKIQEEENLLKSDRSELKAPSAASVHNQLLTLQRQSADGFMRLLQDIGKAYSTLSQYDCAQAAELFALLPLHHYNTGWVLSQVGRAYFEMAEYQKAEKVFQKLRQLEPHYIDGMEIYSTTLWHLQREVLLSKLAQDLTSYDKLSPQAWCAAGNCFSLQKEHDTAIKFFQRAIQVDLNFAYAYTLLGHEYLLVEDLDKAMAAYCSSIRVDARHYNARYGVGMIYYKQEQFAVAEVYFRQALAINPNSSVLLCHIGMVQHALRKSDLALKTLQKASEIDPQNPLCKFHKASILFANDKLKDALKELEELKLIVPKESLVYFLLGKVHKKLGNTHLALMNFSYASDLDPKGTNNQIKEAINKHYVTDEDEVPGASTSSAAEAGDAASSDSSVVEPDDILLHAMESDESL